MGFDGDRCRARLWPHPFSVRASSPIDFDARSWKLWVVGLVKFVAEAVAAPTTFKP